MEFVSRCLVLVDDTGISCMTHSPPSWFLRSVALLTRPSVRPSFTRISRSPVFLLGSAHCATSRRLLVSFSARSRGSSLHTASHSQSSSPCYFTSCLSLFCSCLLVTVFSRMSASSGLSNNRTPPIVTAPPRAALTGRVRPYQLSHYQCHCQS